VTTAEPGAAAPRSPDPGRPGGGLGAILYESRFEKDYGFFGPIIKEVVDRFLDCGNP